MKRIGVIGMGKMGVVHASILNTQPEVEIAAVMDRDKGLKHYLDGIGIRAPFYVSLDDMLDREKLDGIFLCVPSYLNYPLAKVCIERSINIFIEKPLADNLENAEKMIDLVKGKDLKHSTGFMVAYVPTFRKAKEIIDRQTIGRVNSIEASAHLGAVFSRQKAWFYRKEPAGGGAITSLGSHLLFLLIWFFGSIAEVQAELVFSSGNEVEDGGRVHMKVGSGIDAIMDVSWSTPGYDTMGLELFVHASEGSLMVTGQEINLWLNAGTHERIHISEIPDDAKFYLGAEGYCGEDEDFVSCIGTERQPAVTWQDGYKVQKILNAIYHSARISSMVRI